MGAAGVDDAARARAPAGAARRPKLEGIRGRVAGTPLRPAGARRAPSRSGARCGASCRAADSSSACADSSRFRPARRVIYRNLTSKDYFYSHDNHAPAVQHPLRSNRRSDRAGYRRGADRHQRHRHRRHQDGRAPGVDHTAHGRHLGQRGAHRAPDLRAGGEGRRVVTSTGVSSDSGSPFGLPQQGTATGSNFVIDKDGYIVTNAHVVEGADSVTVELSENGESVPARSRASTARRTSRC